MDDLLEEDVNVNEDIVALRTECINESTSPELMHFKHNLVEDVKAAIEQQQQIIEEQRDDPDEIFSSALYQMEIDRVRYMWKYYLRTRLRKIEKHALHLLTNAHMAERMSSDEQDYARGFVDLMERHFKQSALDALPERFHKLMEDGEQEKMIDRPNVNAYVFCRIHDNIGRFSVGDSVEDADFVELNEGDIYVLRYHRIASLIHEGRVELL